LQLTASREIVRFLEASRGALAAAECQTVGPLSVSANLHCEQAAGAAIGRLHLFSSNMPGKVLMSQVLMLEATNQDLFCEVNTDVEWLIGWLQADLVDIFEQHLNEDLSPLRRIAPPRKGALQAPQDIVHAIDRILSHLGGEDEMTNPPDLLTALTQHPEALIWNGEEAYFSNGQFAEDIRWLRSVAEKAISHNVKKVRIVIERW
jgi:hypothetical protein